MALVRYPTNGTAECIQRHLHILNLTLILRATRLHFEEYFPFAFTTSLFVEFKALHYVFSVTA